MEKTAVSSGFYVRRINLSHPLVGSVLEPVRRTIELCQAFVIFNRRCF